MTLRGNMILIGKRYRRKIYRDINAIIEPISIYRNHYGLLYLQYKVISHNGNTDLVGLVESNPWQDIKRQLSEV